MSTRPKGVALVARTHWMVGGVILVSVGLLHFATRRLPGIEFGPRTYWITGGLAGLYLLGGTLVWLGAPFGPLLSRVCGLLYLSRPRLGSYLWETMSSPEFKAHFARSKPTETKSAD
jgi:hypothetical protein